MSLGRPWYCIWRSTPLSLDHAPIGYLTVVTVSLPLNAASLHC